MTILGRTEGLVSRCVECDLAEPESLASLGGSAPGVVDGILSVELFLQTSKMSCQCLMPKGTFLPMTLQDKYKPIKDMYLQGSINPISTLLTGEPMEA